MRHPAKLLSLAALTALIANLPIAPKAIAISSSTLPYSSLPYSRTPSLPDAPTPQPLPLAQTPNPSDRQAEAERLSQQAFEQYQISQFRESLESLLSWEFQSFKKVNILTV